MKKRDERGRRLVWYLAQTNRSGPNGKYTRYEDRGLVTFGEVSWNRPLIQRISPIKKRVQIVNL